MYKMKGLDNKHVQVKKKILAYIFDKLLKKKEKLDKPNRNTMG